MASYETSPRRSDATLSEVPVGAFADKALDKPSSSPPSIEEKSQPPPTAHLSQGRKWFLLSIFSMSFLIDVLAFSTFILFTDYVSADLDIAYSQQTWVITSYTVTFSAFLLFWGRVSDVYSPKPVFVLGFLILGFLDLIISFLPEKFSFFIVRAFAGIAGAALVPSSYRLIVQVFEPHELRQAFLIFGFIGPIASATGTMVAGVLELIPTQGQMIAWRWFFRIMAILIIPTAIGSYYWIPGQEKEVDHEAEAGEVKWKRLDLIGCLIMLFAVILFILSLTLGSSSGFNKPGFIVPFVLCWPLFVGFFFYEARLPERDALIPPAMWKIPNLIILVLMSLYVYAWWATMGVVSVGMWLSVYHQSSIIAAVRFLPEGVGAIVATLLVQFIPKIISHPRWPISAGLLFACVGTALLCVANPQLGTNYWRYLLPGHFIGSGAVMILFNGINVGIMTSTPPKSAGVAGATMQTALQVGTCIGLSIQAGLETISPGGLDTFSNVRTSWFFMIGWGMVWLVLFLVSYRPKKTKEFMEKHGVVLEEGGVPAGH
ncbi:hypothetical protein P7C73_g6131, partial [Tremellales sp. Uapishka_1]